MSGDLRGSRPLTAFDRLMDLADVTGARVSLHVGELVCRPDARQNFRPLTLITAERPGSPLAHRSVVAGDVNDAAARLTQELAS